MWGVLEQLRLGACFFGNFQHGIHEEVQRFNTLRFGRFDHQRLVHDQREVVCGRMEIVIHKPFGDIQCVDIGQVLPAAFEHELMHARAVVG